MRRRAGRIAAILLGGSLGFGVLFAQTTGGIDGVVRDSAGGTLAGVDLLVSSRSLQGTRTARSGAGGRFWVPALPPGVYAVTAAQAGFRPATKTAAVSLSGKVTLEFLLEPALTESVAVSGAAPAIDVTSTTGGTVYTAAVMEQLPLSRNYADIVHANPGVSTDQGLSQGRALSLTIYGATSAENQWLIDGVNTTNSLRGIQGKALNNEFIEEVEVKTGGYSAEYGGALGGVVNVVTKSGGNQFHGGGFVYFDSSDTAARQEFGDDDFAEAQMRWADYERLDYGVDLGGYLLKDRLWFFGAYNRISLDSHVSRVTEAPLVPTSMRFPIDSTDNFYSGKLTWNAAPSTSIVATVFADPTESSGASATDPRQDQRIIRFEDVAIVNPDPDTWSSSRRIGGTDYALRANQLLGSRGFATFQASRHQERNGVTAADKIRTIDLTCQGGAPGAPCDIPTTPNAVEGGFGVIDGPLDHNASFRDLFRGDVTFDAGRHELKAGGSYDYDGGDSTYSVSGGQEVTRYNEQGELYYAHGFIARGTSEPFVITNAVNFQAKSRLIGLYVQDSWKAADGLTLSLGLRYDRQQMINYAGQTLLTLDHEWQPRIGVTWDPWRDGRTKLYAFAGRFYYALPTLGTARAFTDYTIISSYNRDPLALDPDSTIPGRPPFETLFASGPTGDHIDAGLRGIYQDEVTVGAERMLDPTLTVGLKGTYRRLGNTIDDRCDLDPNAPENAGGASCALINPGSGQKYARGDFFSCTGLGEDDNCNPDRYTPLYGAPPTPPARRFYRGIELLVRKTVGSRLWVQASYVYSSLIGNVDGAVDESDPGSSPGLTLDFDYPPLWHDSYGRLYLDRPHQFRLDGAWTTPLGLTLGLQTWAASGPPFDKLGYFNGSANVHLVPRGSAGRLPAQWDANLTLSYPIAVGPATVTLQAYAFSVFNNQVPTSRNASWTTQETPGYPANIYDPNQPPIGDQYGKNTGRTDPRSFRAAVRVSF